MRFSATFNGRTWEDATKLLLVISAGGFGSTITTFLLQFPKFVFESADVTVYQTVVPFFVFLFPFSLGLALAAMGRMSLLVATGVLLVFGVSLVFVVPVYTVQIPLAPHCGGYYTQWQSVGYRLLGIGFHAPEDGCY